MQEVRSFKGESIKSDGREIGPINRAFAYLGIGAGLAFLFDPETGRRRRIFMRDKMIHLLNKTEDAIDVTAKDLRNRMIGFVAEARSLLKREGAVPDEVVAARVKSRIGMIVSHPHAIDVKVEKGHVTLFGDVLEDELQPLLTETSRIRGVTGVESKLALCKEWPTPEIGRRRQRWDLMQENWSPTTRLVMGYLGSQLILYGLRRPGLFRTLAGVSGTAALARSLTNMPLKRILGIGAGYRVIGIKKTINIQAPVERVYSFWENLENFPKFMARVREVRKKDHLWHWVVAGPAGLPVEWDAEMVQNVPNRLLAWKTVPGSVVEHAGTIHFDPNPDGSTRVDIQMSYNPPAGVLGHLVASFFGADPKREMDEDLARLKTFIETGKPPHDAAAAAA